MATPPGLPEEVGRPTRRSGDRPGRPDEVTKALLPAGDRQAVDGWPGLRAAACVGPFFAVDRLDDNPSWLPLSEFADHPDGLAARVSAALESPLLQALRRTAPDVVSIRVAASIAFLGLAARVVSPAIGSTLCIGIVPVLTWDRLCWRPARTGIVPLAFGQVEGLTVGPRSVPDLRAVPDPQAVPDLRAAPDLRAVTALRETVINPTLALGATVAERFGLSGQVVRGNAASAITGAAAAVAGSGRCTVRAAVDLAAALLDQPGLLGAGSFADLDRPRPHFHRNSCCLLYRAGGGLCGDCVLAPDAR